MLLGIVQSLTRWAWRKLPADTDPNALTAAQAKVVAMAGKLPPLHLKPPRQVRKAYRLMEQPFNVDRQTMARICHESVTLEDGSSCSLRIYYPQSLPASGPFPAMVYFHGGGCVIGDLDSHDIFSRWVAHQAGIVLVSVDYRCAPEHPFPVPVTDSIQAWNWVVGNAESLQLDPQRLGVGGDSAGGYLATLICQQTLLPTLGVKPSQLPGYQWLIYPMMDLRGQSDSYRQANDGMLLTRQMMDYFSGHYLGSNLDMQLSAINPILVDDLADLPPTYLLSVGYDPLRDDDILYAKRLVEQGVSVEHKHYPNMMHGFISMGGVCPQALQALQQSIAFLKRNGS
ncbi:alpha/beta hydrolase [Maricurvus nonylphenolicus]|uniref:alpha/beta hydrolase n=1 Tax=Maricurvus nonylphenolicus TaxID=1008307 RepID=UPI0036F39622